MLNEYSAAPGRTVVEVSGEIDVYTAPRLRETLISLVDAGNYHLIVDMEGVEFLDSTGLGVLVGGLKRVRAHDGGIDLVCTQGRILRIFRITGLSKVFAIYDSVDDALAGDATPDGLPSETALSRTCPWFPPGFRRSRLRVERAEHQPSLRLGPERRRFARHALAVRRQLRDGRQRHRVADDRRAVGVQRHPYRLAGVV
jgi:anti-sigma B factor antagonist